MAGAAMRVKSEPTGLEAQLGTLLKGAIGEVVEAAVAKVLPKALAAIRLPARPAEPESAYVNRRKAATIMSYSPSTVGRLIAKGLLRASGTKRDRIARAEIDRFMAAAARREQVTIDEDAALEAEARRIVDDE
jgi:hypothetical protein